MAKLRDDSIKKKIRVTYGDYNIINPEFKKEIYSELAQMIRNNSIEVQIDENLEQSLSDIKIDNTVRIMRYMLINLTNIENEEYWNNIDDTQLDENLNYSDGEFKQIIQTLIDIMLEIAHDNKLEDTRKLNILNDKLIEFKESMTSSMKMQKTLASLNLDMDKLIKIEQGDEVVMKEFQDNIVNELEKQNKPKRQYTKKTKK